jgi:hypothetical protein
MMELTDLNPISDNARDYGIYLTCFYEAKSLLEGIGENTDTEYLTSIRNQILAASPDSAKGRFFGSLATEPTVTVDELVARGTREPEAQMLITGRDFIRTTALALMPVDGGAE